MNNSSNNRFALENCVFKAVEGQRRVLDVLGRYSWRWDVDLGVAEIVFSDEQTGEVILKGPIQVIGSHSLISGTWQWAWANPNIDVKPGALTAVRALCDDRANSGETLYQGAAPVRISNDDLLLEFGVVCTGICEGLTWFVCSYENGRLYVAIERLVPFGDVVLDPLFVSDVILGGSNTFSFQHVPALLNYLGNPNSTDDGTMRWDLPGGTLAVEIDEQNRISKTTAKMIGTGKP
jgi:hypothetical protein